MATKATKKTGKRANSEGSIRERADGRWEARYSYRDDKGLSPKEPINRAVGMGRYKPCNPFVRNGSQGGASSAIT